MARAAAFRHGPFPARAEQGPGSRGRATGADGSAPPRQNENCWCGEVGGAFPPGILYHGRHIAGVFRSGPLSP